MQATQCAICQRKTTFSVLYEKNFSLGDIEKTTFSARRLPDKIRNRIVRCNKCGLVRSNPILSEDIIASLYSESRVNYEDLVGYLRKTYGFYLQLALKKCIRTERFLDIGCGNGFMLEEAQMQGCKEVFGVEPGKEAANQASDKVRKRIKTSLFKRGLFPEDYFDCISCFHTLDHVVDPEDFLRTVFSILKPGGVCLFIVHNVDSLQAKILKSSSPIFDIEHIFLFNKLTLNQIYKQTGFKLVQIFDVKNTYPLSYWLKMSPVPLKSKLLFLLAKFRLVDFPLTLFAGNIGVVAQKVPY